MTHDNFITEYRSSENSVPVNNELKAKLIEMAKELEDSNNQRAEIKINRTKRVRHIIMEISAIAACAALCAYAIPHISDRYFERFNTDPIPVVTDTPAATQTPQKNEETIPTERAENPRIAPESAHPSEQTVTNNKTNAVPAHSQSATEQTEHTDTAPPQRASQSEQESAAPNTIRAQEPEKNNTITVTRSDINDCLDRISKNLVKLNTWDDEITPYAASDNTAAQYYSLYTSSCQDFEISAAEFEESYSDTTQSSRMYEGYEIYTNVLEPKFEDCRASYRKLKNYVEINILSEAEEQTAEITEVAEPEETIEPEEAIVTEECNE